MAGELPLEVHPEALSELERATVWYDRQRSGLGESFFQEITAASPEYEKPRMLGRSIGEARDASWCIASLSRSSIVNARPVSSS